MTKTAVAADADDGREILLLGLRALLRKRVRMEMHGFEAHMRHRRDWLGSFWPFRSPDHRDHPDYEEWRRLHPR